MSKKINNIPQQDIETNKERKWFSIIKYRAKEIDFGKMSVSFTIKGGKITGLRIEREGETYNIGA